ncbi:hypothetical protein MUK42_06397 [Musa troglodytarum]|uniref:Uncharacterized protein n=1 Tax=Musa troglodytarum TaxID=320322 RepID=A0A9E7KDS2_9LILI|nr:hypothetical protein MUK42_06397 [Musa troglodytarum]
MTKTPSRADPCPVEATFEPFDPALQASERPDVLEGQADATPNSNPLFGCLSFSCLPQSSASFVLDSDPLRRRVGADLSSTFFARSKSHPVEGLFLVRDWGSTAQVAA